MQTQNVPNYLVWAILATLFCCMPTGVAAIIFAAQVNTKLAAGDYDGAVKLSNQAKLWCWISFGLGAAFIVLYFLVVVIAIVAGGGR
jgi:hypothetical protein